MGYVACIQCSSLNDETSSTCNSCRSSLSGEGSTWTHQPDARVQARNPKNLGMDRDARYFDLDDRYARKALPNVDVTIWVGIKAALCASLLLALPQGIQRQIAPDDLNRWVHHFSPTTGQHSPMIVAYSIIWSIAFALPLGAVLGRKNLLCFWPEALSCGALVGLALGALLTWLSGSLHYWGLVIGAVQGLVTAGLAHLIEARLIRRVKLN